MLGGGRSCKTQGLTNRGLASIFKMVHCVSCATKCRQPLEGCIDQQGNMAVPPHCAAVRSPIAAQTTSLLQAAVGTMLQLLSTDWQHSRAGSRCLLFRDMLPQCWHSVTHQPHTIYPDRCNASWCHLLQLPVLPTSVESLHRHALPSVDEAMTRLQRREASPRRRAQHATPCMQLVPVRALSRA